MKTKTLSIVRKYKRESRSPFAGDDSTILLLATINNSKTVELKFDRYIYLHRDTLGRWLGISLSQSLMDELADENGKYRTKIEMIKVLYLLKNDIANFLEHFTEEVAAIFGLGATDWVDAVSVHWHSTLCDAGLIGDW